MFAESVHAMGSSQQSIAGEGATFSMLMPFVIIFVIFYFLLIRPQQKERKKLAEFLDNLKAGDKVVTTGGIIGTVHSITGTTLQMKLSDNVKITVLRSSVRSYQENSEEST